MNDPFTIHWFPLISHDVAQLDLPCHPFVVLTHLRLRQWRCSRLCWCPVCKEALVSGKWFAHWQCILCWQRPIVFTVWWINPVDRLTCHRCDTLRNNILKQLFCSQTDITWNRFPSTPGEVQNLSCQKIKHCTKQMKRTHVRNANDHGKLDAQTSQAGFLQQQCYCKHSTHEEIRESVRVNYYVQSHRPARTSSGWMFEWWISDGFEWFFAVSFVNPKFAVLARSKQLMLMPVTVKFRLDFLVSGLQGRLLQHLARVGPMFPCNKGHEVMKNCRDWDFSLRGLEVLPPEFQLPMFAKCDALPKGDLFSMMVASCLQKIESRYPRFGLQDIDCDLGCLIYAYIRDSCKSMKNCRDSAFSLRGLEAGLWAFRLQMFTTCDDMFV